MGRSIRLISHQTAAERASKANKIAPEAALSHVRIAEQFEATANDMIAGVFLPLERFHSLAHGGFGGRGFLYGGNPDAAGAQTPSCSRKTKRDDRYSRPLRLKSPCANLPRDLVVHSTAIAVWRLILHAQRAFTWEIAEQHPSRADFCKVEAICLLPKFLNMQTDQCLCVFLHRLDFGHGGGLFAERGE